jgi:hypothetical protein
VPGKRYAWDQCLWNPSFAELERSVHDAASFANRNRTRGLLDVAELMGWVADVECLWARLVGEPFLWEYATATPTLRTYGEGAAVIGVAWWHGGASKYLVRIVSEDVQAPDAMDLRRQIGPWGLTMGEYVRVHPLAIVSPALYMPPVPRRITGTLAQVARALREQPNVAAWWQHYADLCEDAGDQRGALDARRALEMVLHLGEHRGMILN